MSKNILNEARAYLVDSLKGKHRDYEIRHPWRKDWEFEVLHSLHVESYVLKILAREDYSLSEHEITLIRLAAILHDVAKLDEQVNHAETGAQIVEKWLRDNSDSNLKSKDVVKVREMIADHSNKDVREKDYPKAVLKDADTLDEIGVMSIFMTFDKG